MIKLLITAIWLTFSSGILEVPNWLVSHETQQETPKAADAYCNRGNWPDRGRACEQDSRPTAAVAKPQGIDILIDMDRAQARVATPLAPAGSVRFYDASREAAAPVDATAAPASYSLAGTTSAAPESTIRTTQSMLPENASRDEREPETPTLTQRSRRSFGDRAAQSRPAQTPRRRVAGNAPRQSVMLRVYGVAF